MSFKSLSKDALHAYLPPRLAVKSMSTPSDAIAANRRLHLQRYKNLLTNKGNTTTFFHLQSKKNASHHKKDP